MLPSSARAAASITSSWTSSSAPLTLPITALSSVYGMNRIVNDQTDFAHLAVVLAAMIAISAVLLRWAKQQGWW
jgi:magnesium transporter